MIAPFPSHITEPPTIRSYPSLTESIPSPSPSTVPSHQRKDTHPRFGPWTKTGKEGLPKCRVTLKTEAQRLQKTANQNEADCDVALTRRACDRLVVIFVQQKKHLAGSWRRVGMTITPSHHPLISKCGFSSRRKSRGYHLLPKTKIVTVILRGRVQITTPVRKRGESAVAGRPSVRNQRDQHQH